MIGHVFNIGFEVESLLLYWSAAGRDAESGSRHGSRRRRQGEIVLRTRARKAVRWRHGGRVLVQVVMYPPGGRTSSVTQVLTAEFLRAPRLRMAARRHAADDGVDRFAVTLQVLPVGYHGRVFTNFVQSKKKDRKRRVEMCVQTIYHSQYNKKDLSAATLSNVLLMSGYWSRTALKCSTDKEKRLQ